MLPTSLIGCSTKAYHSAEEALAWADRVAQELAEQGGEGAYVCVPHPLLVPFRERLVPVGMDVGVQDVSQHPPGPFTGEVSGRLLAGLGARYVMVGHPERRRWFGEDDAVAAAKARAAALEGIAPILVCGEAERGEDPEPQLRAQIDAVFGGLPEGSDVIAAYEPTWAIGQAEAAPPEHVARTVGLLRGILDEVVPGARIVYGGSAKPGTYRAIAAAATRPEEVPNGVFLGRGGLDPEGFLAAVAEVREVRSAHQMV